MDRRFKILVRVPFYPVMKTPKPGYKQVTVPDALYDRIQGIAKAEDMSMPDLIRKMLGIMYSDSPAGSGKEIKGK